MYPVLLSHLEKLTGIRAHTFRTWEQRYLLLKNLRNADGWRTYSLAQTRLLLNIALLNQAGYKISDITKMHTLEITGKAAALATDALKQQKAVYALFLHMLALEPDCFEMVLDSCAQHWGLPKTLTAVLIPFLEKTGLLHQPDNTTAGNLIRNIIRHKLIAGIEQLPAPSERSNPVLLFLPQKHHHELALLYMYYLLKRQGMATLYLGANVPPEQIKAIVVANHFKALYTCFYKTELCNDLHALNYYLKHQANTSTLLILNAASQEPAAYAASNIIVFNSIHDTYRMLVEATADDSQELRLQSLPCFAG